MKSPKREFDQGNPAWRSEMHRQAVQPGAICCPSLGPTNLFLPYTRWKAQLKARPGPVRNELDVPLLLQLPVQ